MWNEADSSGQKFSHRPGNRATVGVVRWPSAGDTAGYRLRWRKLTPVDLISMVALSFPMHIVLYFIYVIDFSV